LSTAHGSEAAQAARTRGVGPDALVKRLSGELDWVVLKATEEDPDRRYSSPAELATDLQRYLDGYPVLARPPSRIYTTAKFVRRHRVETAALLALLLGLGAAAAVSTRALLAEQTARREAAAEAERANAVSRFLQEMLGAPDPRAMGRDVRVVDVLDHAVTQARETLGDQPLVRAAVLEAIGNSQRGLSSFERAGELLEEALAIREEVQGPLHPDTLAAANHVIENRAAYRGTDALRPEFVALFERASAVLPDTHPLMMTLYNNLAAVHLTLGRKQGSDELLQQGIGYALRSYDLRRELLGPRAPGTSHARNNLANGYMLVGEPARAEALFRENLAIQREIFGERNQYTLSTMDNLANALARQDRHGEALDWSRQSLEGMREALGPAHLNTLYTQISLARTLQELGRSEEARSLLEHAAELAGDDPGLELARERIDAALAESPVGNPDREAGEG
jgi:tetratricopeptide (TPR) repeat protein